MKKKPTKKPRKERVSKIISLTPQKQAMTIASMISESIDDTVFFHMDKLTRKVGEVLQDMVKSQTDAMHKIKTLPTNLYMMDEKRAAKFLNITVETIKDWNLRGFIHPITIGDKLYYRPEDLVSGKKPFE